MGNAYEMLECGSGKVFGRVILADGASLGQLRSRMLAAGLRLREAPKAKPKPKPKEHATT